MNEHILEPPTKELTPTEQRLIDIGHAIRTRMADKKMTKYLVCKRLNAIAKRDGKTKNTLVSGATSTHHSRHDQ